MSEASSSYLVRLSQGKNVPAIPRSQLAGFGEFLRRLRTTVRRKSEEGLELCAFCRNNGEPFEVYITHKVRLTYYFTFICLHRLGTRQVESRVLYCGCSLVLCASRQGTPLTPLSTAHIGPATTSPLILSPRPEQLYASSSLPISDIMVIYSFMSRNVLSFDK